jgi:hypothetical protein
MLFIITKPSGSPIIVMFNNQAAAIASAPSHQPIKINHKDCIRQPGPVEVCTDDLGFEGVVMVISAPGIVFLKIDLILTRIPLIRKEN